MVSDKDFCTRKFLLECEIAKLEKLGALGDVEKSFHSAYTRQLEILNEHIGNTARSSSVSVSLKGQGSLF